MFRTRLGFAALLLAAAMDHLDGSIVNVVLPVLQRELGADASAAQWIGSGYTLTFGLFLVTAGRFGDLFGRKRLLLSGIAGFTVASALCGLAPIPEVMIAARLLQGLSSAAMVPQVLALIRVLFAEHERGRALGVYAGVTGVAGVSGQLLGAVLTEVDLLGLGWRAVFLINVPAGLLAWAATAGAVPSSRAQQPIRADLGGVALITTGLLLLIGPLTQVHRTGWSAATVVSMAVAAGALAGFAAYQRRRPHTALVPPHLFRLRGFTSGLLITLAMFATIHAFFFTQVLYLQAGLGKSVLYTALIILPWSLGVSAGAAMASTVLVPRFGHRVLDAGLLVFAGGLAAVGVGLAVPDPSYWHWAVSLLVAGVGMGWVVVPVLGLALREVPADDAGAASGLISSAQQIGGALGAAGLGAVFFATWHGVGATTAFQTVIAAGVALLLGCAGYRATGRG